MKADTAPENKNAPYVFHGPRPRRLTAEEFIDTISAITGEWRLAQTDKEAHYVREWELKSTSLSRALGRPIRDQVFTTRTTDATMLQALELVNGETMETLLRRGARRMLGQLPAAPAPLFDSRTLRKEGVDLSIDITGVKQLWFLLADAGSYDPSRTVAAWSGIQLEGPGVTKRLSELPSLAKPQVEGERIIAPVPSTLIYNVEGLGFTRLKGRVLVDESSVTSEINPAVRFYLFSAEPDRHQLVAASGAPPVSAPAVSVNAGTLMDRVYLQALCRTPNAQERRIAERILAPSGRVSVEGLEDFLWSVFMHPEMQYIE